MAGTASSRIVSPLAGSSAKWITAVWFSRARSSAGLATTPGAISTGVSGASSRITLLCCWEALVVAGRKESLLPVEPVSTYRNDCGTIRTFKPVMTMRAATETGGWDVALALGVGWAFGWAAAGVVPATRRGLRLRLAGLEIDCSEFCWMWDGSTTAMTVTVCPGRSTPARPVAWSTLIEMATVFGSSWAGMPLAAVLSPAT